MNRNLALLTVCSAALAVSTGCGRSPLLHHLDAGASAVEQNSEAAVHDPAASNDCPLAFPQSGLCASVTWASAPSTESEGEMTLRFWSSQGGSSAGPFAAPGADVAVKLWMPAMGHGSSPTSVQETSPGVYDVQRIYFIMPGAWEIHIQLKHGADLAEEAVLKVSL